jgi:hypothetical protein
MGGHFYSQDDRAARATTKGYATKAREEIFSACMHASMNPKDVKLRESRDSKEHPEAFPIILGMDETGSMGEVPHYLIKEGLPKLVSQLIENGCPDASLCFIALGDHISDNSPLQIGQFESGDEQLDMHLERTYLEGNGGGNGGESYLLALVFAAFVAQTDQWDKRKLPGVLITLGDEPPHLSIDKNSAVTIFGAQARGWWEGESITAEQLLKLIEGRWVVHHIHVRHGSLNYDNVDHRWKQLLGEAVHVVHVQKGTVADSIAKCVVQTMTAIGMQRTNVPMQSLQDVSDDPFLALAQADGWERTVASGTWRRNPNETASSEELIARYSETTADAVIPGPERAASPQTPSAMPEEEVELI